MFACPLVNLEAMVLQIDTEWSHAIYHGAVRPATEDAACIGAKRNDIAQGFQF